jgi:heme exporter protein B
VATFFRQALTIAAKDLRAELRTKEALNASLAFSIVILVLFSFAFDPDSETAREMSGGLLWVVFSFAGALALNRSFAREMQNDCLDALLASPVPPAALFAGKALANYVLLLAVEFVSLPVFGLFYNIRWTGQFWSLLLVVLLGTWALTAIGTLFSALTVNLRLRELMLPVLVYPLMIPALMAAITLTTDLLSGTPLGPNNLLWVRLLVGGVDCGPAGKLGIEVEPFGAGSARPTLPRHRPHHLELDAVGRRDRHGVREAEQQLDRRAPQRGAVADALDLQALLEALRDALDHVRDQRARQTVQRAIVAALGRPGNGDRPLGLLDLHPGGNLLRELSERAVDHHAARGDRDVHAGWKLDWLSTDSTHLVTRRSTRLRRRFLSLPRCAR